jgi:hypothetical protein
MSHLAIVSAPQMLAFFCECLFCLLAFFFLIPGRVVLKQVGSSGLPGRLGERVC